MNNFITRTVTGAVFVAVLLGAIWFSKESQFVLYLIITGLGINEFYNIYKNSDYKPQKITGIFSGLIIISLSYFISAGIIEFKFLSLILLLLAFIMTAELYRKKDKPFSNIAITIFGIAWVAVPFALAISLTTNSINYESYKPEVIIGILFLIWTNDTGAYLTGMTFGKHRLFERISPKKSWEGSVGGVIFVIGISILISKFFTDLSTINWVIIGVIVAIAGTYGDLVESMFKRSMNIKDSGNILPGHGGILDRFDSLILAIPCIYVYLQLFK